MEYKNKYPFVFVGGMLSWGEENGMYKLPYWGMVCGNLVQQLRDTGIEAYAPQVGPMNSAWDRACNLYAMLTGTRVDYGVAHSKKNNHARYGRTYAPLVQDWGKELPDGGIKKVHLLGHSFGGATVLTLVMLMNAGSEEEMAATPENELSPLFTGGKGDWFYSVTALSAPINGTSAYEVKDEENKFSDVGMTTTLFNTASTPPQDGRAHEDTADWDMHIDHALEMVKGFTVVDSVYYFSIPCCMTDIDPDTGVSVPDTDHMETIFQVSSREMGKFTGYTEGGYYVDESWQPNDGLVNTISARAPFGQPQQDFDENNVVPGVWNVMPTYRGDHMALQGDLMKTNNVRQLYVDLINMINHL